LNAVVLCSFVRRAYILPRALIATIAVSIRKDVTRNYFRGCFGLEAARHEGPIL